MIIFEENSSIPPEHYYGDKVRRSYLLGSFIMLTTLPFFVTRLPISLFSAILLVIIVSLFAGFTNPRQLWTSLLDFLTSLIALCIFEYFAVVAYLSHGATDSFVWVNEILSVVFFFSFYFAIKTVRGFLVERKNG